MKKLRSVATVLSIPNSKPTISRKPPGNMIYSMAIATFARYCMLLAQTWWIRNHRRKQSNYLTRRITVSKHPRVGYTFMQLHQWLIVWPKAANILWYGHNENVVLEISVWVDKLLWQGQDDYGHLHTQMQKLIYRCLVNKTEQHKN